MLLEGARADGQNELCPSGPRSGFKYETFCTPGGIKIPRTRGERIINCIRGEMNAEHRTPPSLAEDDSGDFHIQFFFSSRPKKTKTCLQT